MLSENFKEAYINDLSNEISSLSNPYTGIFVDKMNELNSIYNHTSQICFDKESIYLLA